MSLRRQKKNCNSFPLKSVENEARDLLDWIFTISSPAGKLSRARALAAPPLLPTVTFHDGDLEKKKKTCEWKQVEEEGRIFCYHSN